MKNIAIINSFLSGNFGDDILISHTINMTDFDKYYIIEPKGKDLQDITNSKNTIRKLTKGKDVVFSHWDDIKTKKNTSTLLNVGGSVWPENIIKRDDNSFFFGWIFSASIGNNISHYEDEENYFKAKELLENINFLTLRDKWSAEKVDINSFFHDPIYSMDLHKWVKSKKGKNKYATVTFCKPALVFNQIDKKQEHLNFIYSFLENAKIRKLNLLSFQDSRDLELLAELKDFLKPLKIEIIVNSYKDVGFEGLIELMANSKLNICTRFHSMIISNIFRRKTIPIVYDNKGLNHINDIGFRPERINVISIKGLKYIRKSSISQFHLLNERMKNE